MITQNKEKDHFNKWSSVKDNIVFTMPPNEPVFRAKFIKSQHVALTPHTPLPLAASLSKIYPFLIILNQVLDNLLWINEITSLQMVNLMIAVLSIRYLFTDNISILSLESIVSHLLGYISTWFNWYSLCYYVCSLRDQFDEDPSPTLEEIIWLVDEINDKLLIIRNNLLKIVSNNSFTIKKFCTCIVMISPLQLWVFQYGQISVIDYLTWCLLVINLYHSSWVQVTGKLLWRVVLIRNIYYGFMPGEPPGMMTLEDYIVMKCSSGLNGTLEIDLNELQERQQRDSEGVSMDFAQGIRQILVESQNDDCSSRRIDKIIIIENELNFKYEIIEIIIQQNERKWYGQGWQNEMLNYEKSPFSFILSSNKSCVCEINELSQCENILSNDWEWLENDWQFEPWKYYTSQWEYIGVYDSMNAFTRSRVIKRLIFCQLP